MAVYTPLEPEQVAQMLCICPGVGELVKMEGVAAGSINSIYRVETSERGLLPPHQRGQGHGRFGLRA